MKVRPLCPAIIVCAAGLVTPALAQSNITITNIDKLRARGLLGDTVYIGQLEPGMTIDTHTAFSGQVMALTQGLASDTSVDGVRHATHVAGIMVGAQQNYGGNTYTGIASSAKLYRGVPDQTGGVGRDVAYGRGFNWLTVDNLPNNPGATIVNMSAGLSAANYPQAIRDGATIWADWAANATTSINGNAKQRALIVKSAGNAGYAAGGSITSPGDGYNVLTVGATGGLGNTANYRRVADYSSSGPVSGGRIKPDLVAPGSMIMSPTDRDHNGNTTKDDWHNDDFPNVPTEVSGTSFAAPHVSGVAAQLQGYGNANAFGAPGRDPMTMRAVLINGASKNVFDKDNRRLDAIEKARASTTPLDSQLGSGLLDADRSYDIYSKGAQPWGTYSTGTGGGTWQNLPTANTGWALESVFAGGDTTFHPDAQYRKGSYLTATLAWERKTKLAGGIAQYDGALSNLDLNIRPSLIDPITAQSNSTADSVEHLSAKLPNRSKYVVQVTSGAAAGLEKFGVAWHGYEAPTQVREFNGDFSGDRGALNDNGWFDNSTILASSTVSQATFMPAGDAAWAAQLNPTLPLTSGAIAQEVVTPTQGFWLAFDAAFSIDFTGQLAVKLGGLNLLQLAGYAGGAIMPTAGVNVERYGHYIVDLASNPLTGLAGAFNNLSFEASGSAGSAWIDNVAYVPEPGSIALATLGLLAIARRRRA